MGTFHSDLVGDELHIARTSVSTGDPNGVVTPGIIGEFYWDSDANLLYIAESLLNTSWVHAGSEFDQFIELLDTPSSYSGQAGFVAQVNAGETGLEFGQALRITDSPQFANLTLQPVSGDTNFVMNDSSATEVFNIKFGSGGNNVIISSPLQLAIDSNAGLILEGLGVTMTSLAFMAIAADDDISINTDNIFVEKTTGFVGFGSATPLAQIFVSSLSADTVPVSMQESLGSNGARIKTLVGDQDPEGNVTGDPGDHYWRVDGADSSLFIKKTAAVNTGWLSVLDGSGNVTAAGTLTDNFLVRGDGGVAVDIGNIFMSPDGNDLTIPGALDLIPPEPAIVSTLIDNTDLNGANHITVVNNYAYVTSSTGNSLTIVDITDPNALFVVGSISDGAILTTLTSVHVSGKHAFVTSNVTDCLNIIDITDVSAPVLVGRVVDSVAMDSPDASFVASKFCYVIGQTSDSLAVIDISDPEAPFVAGSLIDAVNFIDPRALYVMGKFAYVTLFVGSLKIVDISDPTNPVIVGTFTDGTNMNGPNQVYVVGRYAYVTADFSDSLTIIDISDPTAPVLAGQIVDTVDLNRPSSLSIDGDYAYVGTIGGPASVIVIDISDRTAPVIIETLLTGTGAIGDLFVSGKFAYIVVSGQDSISAVDLGGIDVSTANIGNLSAGYISVDNEVHIKGLLAASGLDVGFHGIHSDGGISAKGSLTAVPSQPKLVGRLFDPVNINGPRSVYVVNNYAYVGCNIGGSLTILDITEPTNPVIVGVLIDLVNFPNVFDVAVSGKYAYIVSIPTNSLNIIDVSNVSAPVLVGRLVDAVNMNGPESNFIAGKYCYVLGTLSSSLAIIDISDPTTPILVGSLIDGTNLDFSRVIYVLGSFAYVASEGGDSLTIIDISDPTSPTVVGTLFDSVNLNGTGNVFVVGRYAYMTAEDNNSFAIVDVSDPTSPTLVGTVSSNTTLARPQGLSVAGNYAYISTRQISTSFTIIDISDPTNPVITESFGPAAGFMSDIFISGKYAYVPTEADNFLVIDIDGVEASTASIGNVKAGYLSVDNEAVIKGITYSGGFNGGPHGVHSDGDISGLTSFSTFDKGDEVAIARLKNTGANPGRSERFVGNRDPSFTLNGLGGDIYYRGDGPTSGTYENRASVVDQIWFKRSVKPSIIVEINTSAEFEELATGGIITVGFGIELTLIFNIQVITATRFVMNSGGPLNITGADQQNVGISYTGTGTLFSGIGILRILGGVDISGASTGTLMAITDGLVDINRANFFAWDSLGSFEDGFFLLRFVNMNFCDAGFTLINAEIISVFNVAHLGTPGMATPMFTVNTNNPLSIMSFSEIKSSVTSTGSVFDLDTRINFDVDLIDINHVAAEEVPANITAPIFKQTTLITAPISGALNASLAAGTITQFADNLAGGTTVSSTTVYLQNELITISATTNYNGSFQIFNVVAGVSFDIIEPFVGDDATGTTNSERVNFALSGGPLPIALGSSVKIAGTNFYNAFYTVILTALNFIIVNATFRGTNTGTVEVDVSLDETDFRVNAKDCVGIPNSLFLASAFVNANPVIIAGGAFTNGVFRDALFGGVASALTASVSMAKWRMTDEINGTFELISDVIFDGWINYNYALVSGAVPDAFRFKFVIDKGSGFVDLPDPVETVIDIADQIVALSDTFPLKAVKGDLIKPQVVRVAGADSLQFASASINARQSN